MKKLIYRGSWPECLNVWDGDLAAVVDESGCYSRHSHLVQALKRHAGEGYIVFSRKGICYISKI